MTKPFPQPVHRIDGRQKIALDEAQTEWFRENYPCASDRDIITEMGVSINWVKKEANTLGLKKSKEYKASVRKFMAEKARGYWQRVRNGEIENPYTAMRIQDPERFAEIHKNINRKVAAIRRAETLRVLSGVKQETRMRITLKPYSKSQCSHRCSALKRGYWFYEDNSEQGGERWNIYYDKDTKRTPRFEKNLLKDGFNVLDGSNL